MKSAAFHIYQPNDWACGPASARMALSRLGMRASTASLIRETLSNAKTGTRRDALAAVFRRRGFKVDAKSGETLAGLRRLLAGGAAVIVLYREPEAGEGHYALLNSVRRGSVALHDPWHGPNFRMPAKEFVKRWYGTQRRVNTRWRLAASRKNKKGGP